MRYNAAAHCIASDVHQAMLRLECHTPMAGTLLLPLPRHVVAYDHTTVKARLPHSLRRLRTHRRQHRSERKRKRPQPRSVRRCERRVDQRHARSESRVRRASIGQHKKSSISETRKRSKSMRSKADRHYTSRRKELRRRESMHRCPLRTCRGVHPPSSVMLHRARI
jgi:hypothetical protein